MVGNELIAALKPGLPSDSDLEAVSSRVRRGESPKRYVWSPAVPP